MKISDFWLHYFSFYKQSKKRNPRYVTGVTKKKVLEIKFLLNYSESNSFLIINVLERCHKWVKIGSYKKILQIFWIVLKKYIRQVEWIHFFIIIQSRSFNFQTEISRWYQDMPTSMIYNMFQVWFFTLNTIYNQIFKKAIFSQICIFF